MQSTLRTIVIACLLLLASASLARAQIYGDFIFTFNGCVREEPGFSKYGTGNHIPDGVQLGYDCSAISYSPPNNVMILHCATCSNIIPLNIVQMSCTGCTLTLNGGVR